jgi:iron complex outermembrane receptor protein
MRGRFPGFVGPVLVLAGLLLLSASSLSAQQGALAGIVRDASSHQPMAGVQVQIVGAGEATAGGTLTNATGQFRLDLPSGRYSVVAVMVGYQTFRKDGLDVVAGQTHTIDIAMTSRALALNPLVVSVGRGVQEKALNAPAAVSVVPTAQITDRAVTSPVDYVKGLPGVDVVHTGITQSNTVTRGFNNVFSGALLVMVDNRYAFVPSLRLNAYNMIPTNPLDIDRVEVVLGPAAALYGPNAANGVLHIITQSPIDDPGTKISMSGGNRSIFQGAFRQAWKFSDKLGFKVSGQYFQGHDFVYHDPVEMANAKADSVSNPANPNPLIGARDFNAQHYGLTARLDYRPWDDGEVVANYGFNELGRSIELTGLGAGQAKGWRYQYGQVRMKKGRFFAQAFLNKSDAGGTWLLRTGNPVVDRSVFTAAQAQYGFTAAKGLDVITGFDLNHTNPITDSTITGANENHDNTTEIGGYVHATESLSDKVDLVAALRVDHHTQLPNLIYSPRAAIVFKPTPGQNFRLTFNRAFSTPTTNNLFLDIVAGRVPIYQSIGYDVRTEGVPPTGFTWSDRCAGGYGPGYCMYSAFQPGQQLPANGAVLWDQVLVPLALQDPQLQGALAQMHLTPQQFAAIIGNPGAGDLQSILMRFNSENPAVPFVPDQGPTTVGRMRPTITNTLEAGYKGVLADRFRLAVDVYSTRIKDFVGPLRVETPSVFLSGASVASYLVKRMVGAGIPQAAATQLATVIAGNVARVPLGTVAPDQHPNSDLILTYRNFGNVNLWGSDMGFEFLATDRVSLNGSFSYVSKQCFDFNHDGSCYGTQDVALNAPTKKGSIGARYDDKLAGFSLEGRVRYSDAFPMNSGVYVGKVEQYTVLDANANYRLPWASGASVSLTINNLFDRRHQEFVGAPAMGRIALLRLEYDF